jgi:uncharacterized repeat protein (TIGR03833 family)
MPAIPHSQVRLGALVTITLEADQAAGRQVQGTVGEVLTQHNDSRGVKVLLTDGRVGRVQEVLHDGNGPQHYFTPSQQYSAAVPDPPNWQAHTSYPSGRPSSHSQHSPALDPPDPQNWQAHTSHPGGNHSSHMQHTSVPDPQNWQAHTSFPSGHSSAYAQPQHPQHADFRASHIPLLDESPHIPPEERSEQMEYLQSYEASKPASQDDIDQATLQREFPNIDSSLIAAIYGDSKSLSATREMLQELKD